MRDPILERLLEKRGAVTRIAARCGISTAAVSQWRRVPVGRVQEVADALGVAPEEVRPDLFPLPDSGAAPQPQQAEAA